MGSRAGAYPNRGLSPHPCVSRPHDINININIYVRVQYETENKGGGVASPRLQGKGAGRKGSAEAARSSSTKHSKAQKIPMFRLQSPDHSNKIFLMQVLRCDGVMPYVHIKLEFMIVFISLYTTRASPPLRTHMPTQPKACR